MKERGKGLFLEVILFWVYEGLSGMNFLGKRPSLLRELQEETTFFFIIITVSIVISGVMPGNALVILLQPTSLRRKSSLKLALLIRVQSGKQKQLKVF